MQARWKTITGIAAVAAVIFWLHSRPAPPPATPSKSPQILTPKLDHPMQPAPVSTPPPTPSAGAATPQPKLQVCGISDLPPSVGDTVDVASYLFDTTRGTYDRWKAALIGGADARARVAGLALQRVDDIFARSLAADTSLEQLVELATTARDPDIYDVAVGLCQTGLGNEAPVAECRRLSLLEWTKIDPDNATPWLANAAAARDKGDSWAESVAFARAAQAHKVDDDGEALLAAAMAVFPTDATLPERFAAEVHLWGYQAARGRPDLAEISRYCSVTALQQSQIHDQCDAVAELLVDHGGTLLNFSRGRSIGRLLGWPAAKLDQLVRERDTLLQLLASNGGAEDWSCGHMAWTDDFMKRHGEIGELAALRELRDKRAQPGQ